jgi:hypothetical protein
MTIERAGIGRRTVMAALVIRMRVPRGGYKSLPDPGVTRMGQKRSPWLDVKILALTGPALVAV